MKYFDTFTGIGGFTLAINNAYENNHAQSLSEIEQDKERWDRTFNEDRPDGVLPRHWEQSSNPVCIGYSEIDKYADSIYQRHFPNHINYGDITKINAEELPDFDLLVGGFPCQAFSIAGKRGGFEDTRGTLFFDLARILRTKRPRLFVFENVKGLLSHDKGNTFKIIISTLDELGYDTQWQVLNSKNFGVPQNRERVFIIGHLRGTSRPEVFPIRESDGGNTESQGETSGERKRIRGNTASTLAARDYKGGGNLIQLNNPIHSNDRVYGTDGVSLTLNTMQGGNRQPFVATQLGNSKKYGNATGSDVAYTLRASEPNGVMNESQIRRLTPTECERLQGFPDNWTEGVSDTQRYKCCGNAVTVNVVQEIMERLI
jgi:DNA (cytosine-5)-methyltransferase 1